MYTIKKTYTPWWVCCSAALFFAYELMQLHRLNAISPMLMRDLHINATQLGYFSTVYLLADICFLLPAGILLDRFSPKKIILTAVALCVIGTTGFASTNSFLLICVSHFLSGIGNAFCFLSCMLFISRWFPKERRAFVMGVLVTIGMLGAVFAQSPFSVLAEWCGWRGALYIHAILGAGIFALIYAIVEDYPPDARPEERTLSTLPFWKRIKIAVWNKQNIACGLYIGLVNLAPMMISAVWGTLFLTQIHALSLPRASLIVSMISTGTIIGSPLFGWISDRLGQRKPLMVFGSLASLILLLIILLSPSLSESTLFLLFLLFGMCTSAQVLGYPLITGSSPRELIGTSMSVAAFIIMGTAALLQPISGHLIGWSWDGTMHNHIPFYSLKNFFVAFAFYPVGLLLSLLALSKVREGSVHGQTSRLHTTT